MISNLAGIFCLQLSVGLGISLLLLSRKVMGSHFLRMTAVIAAVLVTASAFLGRDTGLLFSLAGGWLAYAATVLWLPIGIERIGVMGGVTAGAFLIWRWLVVVDAGSGSYAADFISVFSGGCVMGLSVTAMNIGHWYLSATQLPIAPLKRTTLALGISIIWRGASLIAAIPLLVAFFPEASREFAHFFRMDDLTLVTIGLIRLLFGIIGPFILTCLAWETVRLRSTQSATGILYAVIAMVLAGEASALYLVLHTAIPA